MVVIDHLAYMSTYLEEEFGLSPILRPAHTYPILEDLKNKISRRVDCGIDWLMIIQISEGSGNVFDQS